LEKASSVVAMLELTRAEQTAFRMAGED
jgi:hypothetical protein